MALELLMPPAAEPVTLDEAKAHLRVSTDDENTLIVRLISAARLAAEAHTGRAFVTQTWRLWRDRWDGTVLTLPRLPLRAVTAFDLYGRDGIAQPMPVTSYMTDLPGGRIVLTAAPPAGLREANGIAVTFEAGYGDAAQIPAAIRTAILHIVAQLYEARGDGAAPPPEQALLLLAPYRVMAL